MRTSNRNAGKRLDPMKDNLVLRRCKQQILRAWADYDARVAAAAALPLGRAFPEPTRPAPEKRAQRLRCDARIKHTPAGLERARRAGPAALREYLHRHRCRNWALPGSKRCRLHGGHSTGPRTPEGKARTIAAMKEGRARWLAKLKAEGRPIPFGRKKGGRNRLPEEREQAVYEKQCAREWRTMVHQSQSARKASRAHRRQERESAAADAARLERFQAGGPFWTEEEWEAL
jgi:hypothetical protein